MASRRESRGPAPLLARLWDSPVGAEGSSRASFAPSESLPPCASSFPASRPGRPRRCPRSRALARWSRDSRRILAATSERLPGSAWRLGGIHERVASFDERVASFDERVASFDEGPLRVWGAPRSVWGAPRSKSHAPRQPRLSTRYAFAAPLRALVAPTPVCDESCLADSASRRTSRPTLPQRARPLAPRFEPTGPHVALPRPLLQPRLFKAIAALPACRAAFQTKGRPPSPPSRARREPSASPPASRASPPPSRASPPASRASPSTSRASPPSSRASPGSGRRRSRSPRRPPPEPGTSRPIKWDACALTTVTRATAPEHGARSCRPNDGGTRSAIEAGP
jgi:hypothetical protein